MNYKNFDAIQYIRSISENCKFAVENGFRFCQISGIQGAEELAENMRKDTAFIAVDDTAEGVTELKEEGPFERCMFTVFVLRRCNVMDMNSRKEAVDMCEKVRKLIMTWLLRDKTALRDAMVYLDADVPKRDTGIVLNGVTGKYFTFSFSLPTDLSFDPSEWINPYMSVRKM